MGYSESEFEDIKKEDFTSRFMCTLGARPNVIDVLTILHHLLDFDEAEKKMSLHQLNDDIEMRLVSYESLKETKLFSRRQKYYCDVTQLEKLRNNK